MNDKTKELVAALAEAAKSLEWAAMIIRDIPENSQYMDSLREAQRLVKENGQ